MASLKKRGNLYYIQFYLPGKKQRRVNLQTDSYQIAKEKLRRFESAQACGDELPLPTRTSIADIVTAYVQHIRTIKTPKSAQTDIYYLREMFGPVCDALKVTSRKLSAKTKKRPAKEGQDRRCKAQVIEPDFFEQITTAMISSFISGPLDKIGLVDLTDVIQRDGILDQINAPSFGPWSSRGHIFGLPHDVHPVMLAYRSDLVEAAGIDVSTIQTWDDYIRVMRPLMNEKDSEGQPRHYLLNLWPTSVDQIEALILQAGGGYFDTDGKPIIDSDAVAKVICHVVVWTTGPNRIAADTPEFDQGANTLKVQGYVIASLVPDWLTGVWMHEIPGLAGKVKLMPLPAWEKGGRRTSVWGGTMLGISRRTRDFEKAWTFAKNLYLNPTIAEKLYREAGIVSPVKKMWTNPLYDEPVAYFSNQPAGRLFLNLAPDVPLRTSSPFHITARERLQQVIRDLLQYAQSKQIYDVEQLRPEAHRLLAAAQEDLQRTIRQNLFEEPAPRPEAAGGR